MGYSIWKPSAVCSELNAMSRPEEYFSVCEINAKAETEKCVLKPRLFAELQ